MMTLLVLSISMKRTDEQNENRDHEWKEIDIAERVDLMNENVEIMSEELDEIDVLNEDC